MALLHAQLDGADLSKMDALMVVDMRVKTVEIVAKLLSMRASYDTTDIRLCFL